MLFAFIALYSCINVFSATDSTALKKDTIKHWKNGLFTSFSFTNVKFDNWAAGGDNSVAAMAVINCYSSYKDSMSSWDNTFDAGYGLLKSGSAPYRKNDDKFEINSKYGRLATKKLYYSSLINFKSQFQDGKKYTDTSSTIVSRFMAPAYLTVALGMDYKPKDYFSLFASPLTGRLTMVLDNALADSGSFGVVRGKHHKEELGAYIRARFQKELGRKKNVNLLSTINIFNNYTDENKENRKNVDINWETMINIKLGKYLATSIFVNLVYDDNTSKKLQFKEVLGFGISYKFASMK